MNARWMKRVPANRTAGESLAPTRRDEMVRLDSACHSFVRGFVISARNVGTAPPRPLRSSPVEACMEGHLARLGERDEALVERAASQLEIR
jgi:hypothetical protein